MEQSQTLHWFLKLRFRVVLLTFHWTQSKIQFSSAASVVSDSVRPHRRQPSRLLCPWDSPGKNTGVGCYFLLQGIFQGSNLCLLHWQTDSLSLSHQGSPQFC